MKIARSNDEPAECGLSSGGNQRDTALLEFVRELLEKHGASMSDSDQEDGLYFMLAEADAVVVQHHENSVDMPTSRHSIRRSRITLLTVCEQLMLGGYALTLVASPRTLMLQIREDQRQLTTA